MGVEREPTMFCKFMNHKGLHKDTVWSDQYSTKLGAFGPQTRGAGRNVGHQETTSSINIWTKGAF